MQRSMFAILSAIIDRAMASQPSAESPDHEHRQQKRDDHAHADEHIGENDSGALSMAIQYGQSSGSLMRALHPRISALLIPERSDVREVGEVEHGASDWGGGASSDGSASAT